MNEAEWRASRKPLLKPKDQPKQPSKMASAPKYTKPEKEKTWEQVWHWLKPRLDKAGRTDCEFVGIVEHKCSKILDPCHSKKRRKMKGNDIYAVAIGCRTVHNLLDGIKVYEKFGRRIQQKEMERFVMEAINRHGGIILP